MVVVTLATAMYARPMSDELAMLRRAILAYTRSRPGRWRVAMERAIDDLTAMIASGRTFDDPPPPR